MTSKYCQKHCYKQFDEKLQKQMFENFWRIGVYDKQNYLLFNSMSKKPNKVKKQKKRSEQSEQREQSEQSEQSDQDENDQLDNIENAKSCKFNYYLMSFGNEVHVCKGFFMSVLQVSQKRIRILQQKILKGLSPDDQRGHNDNRKMILNDIWNFLHQIVDRIPKSYSHYSFHRTNRLYFENTELNMLSLYKHFVKELEDNNLEKLSFGSFINYFNTNFKISFSKPKSDICDFCYLNMVIGNQYLSKSELEKLEKHQQDVLKYRFLKSELLNNFNYLLIEIDYSQNKPLPKLSVTKNFYSRNLWLYLFNLHVHNNKSKDTYFYHFIEGEFRKGSDSVASFIYDFLIKIDLDFYEQIVIFSDACGGQNRNYLIMKFLCLMAIQFKKTILQVFPVRGHSYNVCDRNFANISKKVKKMQAIEVPKQYYDIITQLNYHQIKANVFNWQKLFQENFKPNKCKMEISQYYKIEYFATGFIRTFKEYDSNLTEFKLLNDIPFNWKENLKLDLKHFVSREKNSRHKRFASIFKT